jgi:CRISPR-associated protein Csd1
MSWIQKLSETYDRCAGHEPDGADTLTPISHTVQQAHLEIAIDQDGGFRRARVVEKENTTLPATEQSANRTSGEAPHPLGDKIQYCAGDYAKFGGKKDAYFSGYLKQLQEWCNSDASHPKASAILAYIGKGNVVADLVKAELLIVENDVLITKWSGDAPEPELLKQLTAKKIKNDDGVEEIVKDQGDALVRWVVECHGDPNVQTWKDKSLQKSWQRFYSSLQTKRGLCMVCGDMTSILAEQHPAKLRNGADKAKLISSNDTSGYTFRGRFFEADEAAGVSFEATQKAHNALRWLIARQSYRNGDQVFVSWAVSGKPVPDPFASTLDLFSITSVIESVSIIDTAQAFALRLKQAMAGYGSKLDPTEDIVVMGLDSATPGRLAITFYRELKGSEFLKRIETWHAKYAWSQNFGKDSKFIGAPAPRDIAEAAYGRRLDDKLRKVVVERLLPCIVDSQRVPRDLIESTTRRAINRMSFESWEWEKCLGIACALFRGYHADRSYQMEIELDRKTRDYLYGRLLAIADNIEDYALCLTNEGKKRETTAARLMQRFADRPFSTWRNIELALGPYKTRLQAGSEKSAAFLAKRKRLLDEVVATLDSIKERTSDAPLSGEFLLGYHCQRQVLKSRGGESASENDVAEHSVNELSITN